MIYRICFLLLTLLFFSETSFSQTQKDTIYAVESTVPVIIDGAADDACWGKMDWRPINQVWIPYAAKMAAGDFEGKYKVAWDSLYLYVLVEVVDDMISDDHPDPLQNWWDDDCVEVFLDENRSKGDHLKNYNAFAYHISTKYDAIDMDKNGNGINLKKNITVKMDTVGTNKYLWEMAIKVYNVNFNPNNTEASRVKLINKKLMGFSIAYCDNDKGTTRENFIGSMYMTAATANDNYITADYFGSLLLVNKDFSTAVIPEKADDSKWFSVFPNPAENQLTIENHNRSKENFQIELRTISGSLIRSQHFDGQKQIIGIENLTPGIYFLTISSSANAQTERIVIH